MQRQGLCPLSEARTNLHRRGTPDPEKLKVGVISYRLLHAVSVFLQLLAVEGCIYRFQSVEYLIIMAVLGSGCPVLSGTCHVLGSVMLMGPEVWQSW